MVPLRLRQGGFLLVTILVVELDFVSGQSTRLGSGSNSADAEQVIKHFDFDERSQGNLESIPMLWERHRGPGFPKYANGEFDFQVGYAARPSFYLHSNGRNCAYRDRSQA